MIFGYKYWSCGVWSRVFGVWSWVVMFGQGLRSLVKGLWCLVKGSDGFGQILWWFLVHIFINSNIHYTKHNFMLITEVHSVLPQCSQ